MFVIQLATIHIHPPFKKGFQMGGSSSKQPTVVRPQPPSAAWNPGVNNQPTVSVRGLHGSVREASQINLPSRSQISELSAPRASTWRIAPQPPLEQKSNNSATIRRQLPPLQVPANTTHIAPVRVFEQPATPKPSEPKPRANVSPLHTVNHQDLTEKMVQLKTKVTTTSTSASPTLIQYKNNEQTFEDVQRYLNEVGLGSAKPVKQVKRLQNSQQVPGASVHRAGSFRENSAPQAAAGGIRKTPGKMPPLNQGKVFSVEISV